MDGGAHTLRQPVVDVRKTRAGRRIHGPLNGDPIKAGVKTATRRAYSNPIMILKLGQLDPKGCRLGVYSTGPKVHDPISAHAMAGRMPTVPDEVLAQNVWEAGDNDCFAELFARYRKKIFYACLGFFPDSQTAEDATQETFLRAYKNIRGFKGGDFSSWLMRIAKNVCIDEWRKLRPETGIDELELADRATPDSLAATIDTRRMIERLWQEIRALPSEQRQCLELKIEGFSYEETAARTGLAVHAVKSHLQNGRRMLWRKFEGALPQFIKG